LVNLKTKSAGYGYPKKAIEKTVLLFLGSRTFSHGLGRDRTPTLPAVFNITTPRVAWKVRPDSLLEGTGFEPSVPREAAGIFVISVLVRADFSACRESSK
jgi:hypothetical protein